MSREPVARTHLVAGLVAFAVISAFCKHSHLRAVADPVAVAEVKQAILWGMLLLVPAMAAAGSTGFRLGGKSTAPVIARKRRRMPAIALNGIIPVPSAFFLAARAEAGQFDAAFHAVQGLELVAGAVNIALMALNIRDGFALTRKRRRRGSPARSAAAA